MHKILEPHTCNQAAKPRKVYGCKHVRHVRGFRAGLGGFCTRLRNSRAGLRGFGVGLRGFRAGLRVVSYK